ncbi:hypothetical protein ABTA44_21270, partial [Acinetobacter baumannii]
MRHAAIGPLTIYGQVGNRHRPHASPGSATAGEGIRMQDDSATADGKPRDFVTSLEHGLSVLSSF